MGLLISVLIMCVGVVEIINFYKKIHRNFQAINNSKTSTSNDLYNIRNIYLNSLSKHHQNEIIVDDLQQLQKDQTSTASITDFELTEDIELEFDGHLIIDSSLQTNEEKQRRFLLTETRSRSSSPSVRRCFHVIDQPSLEENGEKNAIDLPEFHVKEKRGDSLPLRQFVLKNKSLPSVKLPLPKQFIVNKQPNTPPIILSDDDNNNENHERTPSPYPCGSSVPSSRNRSGNNDNKPTISVAEIDEDNLLYHDSNKKEQLLYDESISKHNSSEYWSTNLLVMSHNNRRQKSVSPCRHRLEQPTTLQRQRSKSASSPGDDCNDVVGNFMDLSLLDSGNTKKKIVRGSTSRKSRKRRSHQSNTMNDNNSEDGNHITTKYDTAVVAKTLTNEAANNNVEEFVSGVEDDVDEALAGVNG